MAVDFLHSWPGTIITTAPNQTPNSSPHLSDTKTIMSHPCFVPSASFSLGVNPPSPSPMESEATAVDDEQLLNRVSSHGADLDTDHHNLHGNSDDCEAIFVQHYNSDDVLLGRGKSNQKHPGNIHFRCKYLLDVLVAESVLACLHVMQIRSRKDSLALAPLPCAFLWQP
jgi:hypothetical protein